MIEMLEPHNVPNRRLHFIYLTGWYLKRNVDLFQVGWLH